MADEPAPNNVINMTAKTKLIREAREARERRKAEREQPQHPGGIDDMDIG